MNKSIKQPTSRRITLQSSATIMTVFVMLIFYAAITTKEWLLIVYAAPYLLAIGLAYLVLSDKVKSETVRRLTLLLNIVGGISVILLVLFYFSFSHNYTW